ncbi:type VI secretion system Vgr family protein [Pseudoduganella plicata]|uniref:type VI secretion system Vgr family protein n=1 Tax=Pseudoduganella plicata TaxID=321984 RepID=UPI001E469CE5|nr:type VI secretion system Vgr family protein [Pseudoduganella plicata]
MTTPLGAEQLIPECLRGEEAISRPYELTVTAVSPDARIALKSLLGQPVLLQLMTAASRTELRPFHGHVTSARLLGADGGLARHELTIGPWCAFMDMGRDSRVFQDATVFDILDSIFNSWQNPGKLVPQWRYDIAERDIYQKRSLTCQYQESNLAFAERLMLEEGLFYWFEHGADGHTMVIADHNGAFQPNAQATVRFSQPGAVMREDSIDRWRNELRWTAGGVELGSWDYRSNDTRRVGAASALAAPGAPSLRDAPGAYAYTSREHGQRIADRQLEAIEAGREIFTGAGTVRTLSPGTTFALQDHALLDAAPDSERTFIVTRVLHLAHNNLAAEVRSVLERTLGVNALAERIAMEQGRSLHAVGTGIAERPLYRNRIDAIRSNVPYRSSTTDGHGVVLRPKPTVRGQQTAVVVGPPGAVVHTDRDHRIKVQFHWQRGEQSHSRLTHPAPDGHTGAPGDDQAGTWVRIATPMAPVAGTNWGAVAVPRIGSEVLVDFLDGDIDRPVVIGSLYNGSGATDAQNNQVAGGAGVATGNAPAWFPGEGGGHAHPATLSGLKSQALQASQSGTGAFSQLVFDDTPAEPRLALQRHARAHEGTDELNLGHLRHQTDNQRLQGAGFGAELKSAHSAALRAGQGLLMTTNARNNASGHQLDSGEASAQVEQSAELAQSMADLAQKHNAKLKDEPAPEKLSAVTGLNKSIEVLGATGGAGGGDGETGGAGQATAFSEPHLQLSSPSGIAATTPANAVVAAGSTSTVTAGQDLNFAAQANANYQLKDGISLFTYGKASATGKPNQETGLRLHAASGRVSVQSQSDVTKVTADKLVTVASIGRSISISAKEHVMLTAQGAYLKLEGGNIMIHGPGTMVFKASMKELGGPASALPTLPGLPKAENIDNAVELNFHYEDLVPVAHAPYKITFADGTSRSGTLDAKGYALVSNVPPGDYHVEYGEEPVPWLPPALEPDPELERARASKERVAALIEEARRKQEKGTSA